MCNLMSVSYYQYCCGCTHSSFGVADITNVGTCVTGVSCMSLHYLPVELFKIAYIHIFEKGDAL